MTVAPTKQIPGVYHRRVGDIMVTALSDGTLVRTPEILRDIAATDVERLFAEAFRPAMIISVNAFLIRGAGRLALVETGSGNYLGTTAGHLPVNLAASGVSPAEIETVLLTHMHPDHS